MPPRSWSTPPARPADPIPYESLAPPEPLPEPGLAYDGLAIDNVYAYDRDGRLLQDVRLYDDQGRPLEFGRDFDNTGRRLVTDERGATAFNAYPVRYFDPGTTRVADPAAGAPPAPPRLTTPALEPGDAEGAARRDGRRRGRDR